ncbi:uncharacterized protein JCM10292_004878 [Rhodotorula paludigena]|uniref:uncharacterized protein n=1 Tax=Rhodotorula paludigena TaxID=86838 RepID=UPI00316DA338
MSAHPLDINAVSEWNTALRSATADGQTVIVDFWATWCGPCKAIAPVYDNLAKQYSWVKFLRVDVDKQQAIAQKYQISAMPTFVAIKAGKVVDTLKGADPAGLNRLVATHAGPNPPIPPLSAEAEAAKEEGNALFKAGDYAGARDKYGKAIELAPTSFVLLGNRAFASLKLASPDYSSALSDAEAAVKLAPTWAKGHVRRGEALQGLGRVDEAVKAFEEAVRTGTGQVKTEAAQKLEKAKTKLQ